MTTTTASWSDTIVDAAGTQLHLVQGGSGEPLLILHDEMGYVGWQRFHAELAHQFQLYVPKHPGFGDTPRLDWIRNMRDLAGWYLEALDDLGLDHINLLGYGLGGWLAAEMAVMCPQQFKKLVVVSAPGLLPTQGEIFDIFLVVAKEYIARGFYAPTDTPEYQELYGGEIGGELAETWELAREETCRLTWRPFMYDAALGPLLHRLKRLPTLILWGRNDAIVPGNIGDAYQAAIPGARLITLENCGHHPEVEQCEAFVQHVEAFLR